HAEVAVAERENGFDGVLARRIESLLFDPPGRRLLLGIVALGECLDIELCKVVDDDIGPGIAQRLAISSPVDADHETESSRTGSHHAGYGILESHRAHRRYAELLG